ncbi:MAG: hypothetical protein LC670_10485 [Flavobacteriales bacterium]|nr:hypothetical protein [Flavobacteriales bacterium]
MKSAFFKVLATFVISITVSSESYSQKEEYGIDETIQYINDLSELNLDCPKFEILGIQNGLLTFRVIECQNYHLINFTEFHESRPHRFKKESTSPLKFSANRAILLSSIPEGRIETLKVTSKMRNSDFKILYQAMLDGTYYRFKGFQLYYGDFYTGEWETDSFEALEIYFRHSPNKEESMLIAFNHLFELLGDEKSLWKEQKTDPFAPK